MIYAKVNASRNDGTGVRGVAYGDIRENFAESPPRMLCFPRGVVRCTGCMQSASQRRGPMKEFVVAVAAFAALAVPYAVAQRWMPGYDAEGQRAGYDAGAGAGSDGDAGRTAAGGERRAMGDLSLHV